MKRTKTLLALSLSLCASVISAKENVGLNGGKVGGSSATTAACTPATAKADLSINNVRALILSGGDMWWDQGLEVARYEVPKGSGKHSYFAAALWIGGLDQGGQLRTAAQTYRQTGNDFWPGPLDVTNASIDGTGCSRWDKMFQIYRQDVSDYAAYLSSPSDFPGYSIPSSITDYPGNGDVTLNEDLTMAPFWDINGDGLYRPEDGDYPKYDIFNTASSGGGCSNFLFGDQTLFWVFNDKGNIHSESGGQPMGLEIRAQAFAFATNDEINDMTFYQYQIINRSNVTISNTYFGSWNDPDLGVYNDDYIGCDVQNGLGFCYNSDDQDGTGSGNSYGDKPPCSAVDFFKGPKADPYLVNGVETDRPLNQTISGSGYGDGIIGNETLGMEYFMIFKNDPSVQGNPSQATHFYNYLQSKWKDGDNLTYGGSGKGGSVPCKFGFPWTSDSANANVDWQCAEAADWRFIHSAGPFTLKPGAVNFVTTGCVWAQAQSGGAKASVELVRVADKKAQALFDNCFAVLEGPRAPDLSIQELNNQLLLYISNPDVVTFNNRGERYQELDPLIPAIAGNDRTYDFEGYLIYQVKDGTVTGSESDLNDPSKARLAAQCDLKNEYGQLVNFSFNPALNANEPVLKNPTIDGYNKGIRHSFKMTEDKFAAGTDKKLVNHKTYYYLAIAYGANNFKEYNQTDPSSFDGQKKPYISGAKNAKGQGVSPVAGIPHITSPENGGTTAQSGYGDGPQIKRVEGQGSGYQNLELTEETISEILEKGKVDQPVYKSAAGPIDVKVIDPLNVPDGEFKLKFVSHALVPKISLQGGSIDSVTAARRNRFDEPKNIEFVYANVPLNSNVYAIQGIINDTTYLVRRVKDILTAVDTAAWVLTNTITSDSVSSDTCINIENEKLILKWGLSVRITKAVAPSVDMADNQNGFINSSYELEDPTKAWLIGFPDQDGQSAFNWIRSGTQTYPNPVPGTTFIGNDFIGVDDGQFYEQILDGTWAPYILTSSDWNGISWSNVTFGPAAKKRQYLRTIRSVDIVVTKDQSKWTRCPVIEMQDDVSLSEGGAAKFDLRKSASRGKDGKDDGSGTTGMSWFPGYAICVETGERLNMAFGEDSWLVADNGRDMIWNPTSSFADNFSNGTTTGIKMGGKHIIYVFGHSGNTGDDMPIYDKGEFIRTRLSANSLPQKVLVYEDCMWAGIPLVIPNTEFLGTDVKLKIRVARPYNRFWAGNSILNSKYDPLAPGAGSNAQNADFPLYSFGTGDLATIKGGEGVAENALDLINVVPNPYFSYSAYENNTLDNIVKITNLPQNCVISIYTVNGTLIRRFQKDDPKTSLDWDLKNQRNVPIASGLYLIHVNVPDVGEKIVKFFGTLRPIDLDQFLIKLNTSIVMISNNRLRLKTFAAGILLVGTVMAGNSDRAGQAGGTQLLINPFVRSSGWGSANSASVMGLEAQYLNVAGVAHTEKTEILAARTNWLVGTGISINSFGFSQKLGNASALAFGVMAMDFGDINVTTVEQPEGNLGTFKPQFLNMNLSYAKEFSNSIFGGINVKVISENIANLKASGVCFDGGIQYVTAFGKDKELKEKNVHFGIALKNVGPQVKYQGDGLSAKANLTSTGAAQTLEFRSQAYDLPSLVNIGASYDYYLSKENNNQRITAALNFTSNSFTQDQFNIGFEYGFKQMFMLRAGMVYEKGIFNADERKTALTGPTAGFSADVPLGKESKRKFGIEYSYRTTNPFAGVHSIGLRLKL